MMGVGLAGLEGWFTRAVCCLFSFVFIFLGFVVCIGEGFVFVVIDTMVYGFLRSAKLVSFVGLLSQGPYIRVLSRTLKGENHHQPDCVFHLLLLLLYRWDFRVAESAAEFRSQGAQQQGKLAGLHTFGALDSPRYLPNFTLPTLSRATGASLYT
jgi:hypothetical protein